MSADGAEASTGLGGVTGSGSISFPAAASGGAMIDFDAMSGVAGVAAATFEVSCAGNDGGPGTCSGSAGRGFSAMAASVVATGDGAGAAAGPCAGWVSVAGEVAAACAEAAAEFCRAIVPVTESSPCSRTVTREYSRSRSLLRVSIAAASRRVSFWLSLATAWICCDCRTRSAAATWSRRNPSRTDWQAAPRSPRRPRRRPMIPAAKRAAVELVLLGQKSAQQTTGIFGLEAASQLVGIFRHKTYQALPKPAESHGKH
jgi:hypothetical protein